MKNKAYISTVTNIGCRVVIYLHLPNGRVFRFDDSELLESELAAATRASMISSEVEW